MKSPENLTPKGVTKFSADSAGTSALPGRRGVPVERKKEKELAKPRNLKKSIILGGTALATTVGGGALALGTEAHIANDMPLTVPAIAQDVYHGIPEKAVEHWRDVMGFFGFGKIPETPEAPVNVPSTFTEITDTKALDHATGADGTPLDQLPTTTRVTASETVFHAASNGIEVSPEELSLLLKNAVEPYNNETGSVDIKMLFPIKNPGDQKIIVEKIARVVKGGGGEYSYPHMFVSWEIDLAIPKKDSVLIMSLDGMLNNAEVFRVAPLKGRDGNLYFQRMLIRFVGHDRTKYELFISNDEYSNKPYQTLSLDSILPALTDAPVVGEDGTYIPFDSKYANVEGKKLPAGTDLLKTVHNDGRLSLTLVGSNIRGTLPFDFFSSQDEKLLYTS